MDIEISDQDTDDFARGLVAIKVTRPDGVSRRWRIPKRLLQRPGMAEIVCEELTAEVNEVRTR